jgi:hypothetical protein
LGHRPARPFEAVSEALALFDPDPERARRQIRAWLGSEAAPELGRSPAAGGDPPTRSESRGFEALLREVCVAHGLSAEVLRSRRRTPRIAAARASLASRATAELGLSGSEIARRLGLSSAAVSLMLARERSVRANFLKS